jgi:hypothetical protein
MLTVPDPLMVVDRVFEEKFFPSKEPELLTTIFALSVLPVMFNDPEPLITPL